MWFFDELAKEWPVIRGAPLAVFMLAGAMIIVIWYLINWAYRARVDGLKEQNKALVDHRELAEARGKFTDEQLKAAKSQSESFQAQLAAATPNKALLDSAANVTATISSSLTANAEVVRILREPEYTPPPLATMSQDEFERRKRAAFTLTQKSS